MSTPGLESCSSTLFRTGCFPRRISHSYLQSSPSQTRGASGCLSARTVAAAAVLLSPHRFFISSSTSWGHSSLLDSAGKLSASDLSFHSTQRRELATQGGPARLFDAPLWISAVRMHSGLTLRSPPACVLRRALQSSPRCVCPYAKFSPCSNVPQY